MADWRVNGFVPDSEDEGDEISIDLNTEGNVDVDATNKINPGYRHRPISKNAENQPQADANIGTTTRQLEIYTTTQKENEYGGSQELEYYSSNSTSEKLEDALSQGLQTVRELLNSSQAQPGLDLTSSRSHQNSKLDFVQGGIVRDILGDDSDSPLSSVPSSLQNSPILGPALPDASVLRLLKNVPPLKLAISTTTSPIVHFEDDAPDFGHIHDRSLRRRKAIQLRPYALEDAMYQQSWREHGLRPVQVPIRQNAAGMETTQQCQEESQGSEAFRSSQVKDSAQKTVAEDRPRPEEESQSPVRGTRADRQQPAAFVEDELPELNSILSERSVRPPRKRRKTQEAEAILSRGPAEQAFKIFDLPSDDELTRFPKVGSREEHNSIPSPPRSESVMSFDLLPISRSPTGQDTPRALPTPLQSSVPGSCRRVSDDICAESTQEKETGQALNASRSRPIEVHTSASHDIQKRLRGVLPLSYSKLDSKQKTKKQQAKLAAGSSLPKRVNDKGVAHPVTSSRRIRVNVPNIFEMSSDSDSEDGLLPRAPGLRGETRDVAGPVVSGDWHGFQLIGPEPDEELVDPTLPSPIGRKRRASGPRKHYRSYSSGHKAAKPKLVSAERPIVSQAAKMARKTSSKKDKLRRKLFDAYDMQDLGRDRQPRFLRIAARQTHRPSQRLRPTKSSLPTATTAVEDASSRQHVLLPASARLDQDTEPVEYVHETRQGPSVGSGLYQRRSFFNNVQDLQAASPEDVHSPFENRPSARRRAGMSSNRLSTGLREECERSEKARESARCVQSNTSPQRVSLLNIPSVPNRSGHGMLSHRTEDSSVRSAQLEIPKAVRRPLAVSRTISKKVRNVPRSASRASIASLVSVQRTDTDASDAVGPSLWPQRTGDGISPVQKAQSIITPAHRPSRHTSRKNALPQEWHGDPGLQFVHLTSPDAGSDSETTNVDFCAELCSRWGWDLNEGFIRGCYDVYDAMKAQDDFIMEDDNLRMFLSILQTRLKIFCRTQQDGSMTGDRAIRNLLFSLVPNSPTVSSRREITDENAIDECVESVSQNFMLFQTLIKAAPATFASQLLTALGRQVDLSTAHGKICFLVVQTWRDLTRHAALQHTDDILIRSLSQWMQRLLFDTAQRLDSDSKPLAKESASRLPSAQIEIRQRFDERAREDKRLLLNFLSAYQAGVKECNRITSVSELMRIAEGTPVVKLAMVASDLGDKVAGAAIQVLQSYVSKLRTFGSEDTSVSVVLPRLKEVLQGWLSDDRTVGTTFFEHLVGIWADIAACLVKSRRRSWEEFLEPRSTNSLDMMVGDRNLLEAKVLLLAYGLELDAEDLLLEQRFRIFTLWTQALLQPPGKMKFEHILTRAIFKHEQQSLDLRSLSSGLEQSDGVVMDLNDVLLYREPIIHHIVQNIFAQEEDSEADWLPGGLETHEQTSLLKTVTDTMRSTWFKLRTQPEAQAEYTKFVHSILEDFEIYRRRDFQVDPWFSNGRELPLRPKKLYFEQVFFEFVSNGKTRGHQGDHGHLPYDFVANFHRQLSLINQDQDPTQLQDFVDRMSDVFPCTWTAQDGRARGADTGISTSINTNTNPRTTRRKTFHPEDQAFFLSKILAPCIDTTNAGLPPRNCIAPIKAVCRLLKTLHFGILDQGVDAIATIATSLVPVIKAITTVLTDLDGRLDETQEDGELRKLLVDTAVEALLCVREYGTVEVDQIEVDLHTIEEADERLWIDEGGRDAQRSDSEVDHYFFY